MSAPKGECHITRDDLMAHAKGQVLALVAPRISVLGALYRLPRRVTHDGDSPTRRCCDSRW
jgi:hypothetical protein